MAVWQVHFELIPLNEKSINLSFESVERLSKILPREKSWSSSIDQYGLLDETCVEVSYKDKSKEMIEYISVRLGLYSVTPEMMEAVLTFAQNNDLMILYEEKECLATKENLKAIVISSNAFKFIRDPQAFFEKRRNDPLN